MENNIEIFEKFLDNKLSLSEKKNFEDSLRKNSELLQELKEYIAGRAAINLASNERLKIKFDEIRMSSENQRTDKTFLRPILYTAASIALLLGISWYFFYHKNSPRNSNEFFLAFYKRPLINNIIERGTSNNDIEENILDSAIYFYSNNEISKAKNEFEKLAYDSSSKYISSISFYLGICYLESNKIDTAILMFDRVRKESIFVFETQWYKAISLIKLGKMSDAINILQTIIQNKLHPKKKEAEKLLKILMK